MSHLRRTEPMSGQCPLAVGNPAAHLHDHYWKEFDAGDVDWRWSWRPMQCSFCGGIKPEHVLQLLYEGWEDERSTKMYKGYLHTPGYTERHNALLNAMDKGVAVPDRHVPSTWALTKAMKFYTEHFTQKQLEELNDLRCKKPRKV